MVLVNADLLRRAAVRLEELTVQEVTPGELRQDVEDHKLVELLKCAASGEQVE